MHRPRQRLHIADAVTVVCADVGTVFCADASTDVGTDACTDVSTDARTLHQLPKDLLAVSVLRTAEHDVCLSQLGRMITGLASPREFDRLRDGIGIAFFYLTNARQAASRLFPNARRLRRLFRL